MYIIDGALHFINAPYWTKVPTVFVYQLIDGEYQSQAFRGKDRIISPTFPELELTVEQVVTASQPRIR